MNIEVDTSKAKKKIQAVVNAASQYQSATFPSTVIRICDENIKEDCLIDTGQLKASFAGQIMRGGEVVYGPTGKRDDGQENQTVLWHLVNSHGGRDDWFTPAAARADREIRVRALAEMLVKIKGSYR
jgi:hypothetical protein